MMVKEVFLMLPVSTSSMDSLHDCAATDTMVPVSPSYLPPATLAHAPTSMGLLS